MSKLLVHYMPWFGDGNNHRMNSYISNNPYTIAKQIDLMKKTSIFGVPIEGVIATWQGPLSTFQHSSVVEMAQQCGERGMLFCLLLDPWCGKLGDGKDATANVTNALKDPTVQVMLNGPSYVPEKYILDFTTGANLSTLGVTFPSYRFLVQGTGFSWVKVDMSITDSLARNANAINNIKTQNANPFMKIPGICFEFNDAGQPIPVGIAPNKWTGTRDQTQSVWGGQAARVLDNQAGSMLYTEMLNTSSANPYMGLITWNDYDERTAIEPYAAMFSGVVIS